MIPARVAAGGRSNTATGGDDVSRIEFDAADLKTDLAEVQRTCLHEFWAGFAVLMADFPTEVRCTWTSLSSKPKERRYSNAESTQSSQTYRTADVAAHRPKETLTPFVKLEARFSRTRTGPLYHIIHQ